MHYSIKKQVFPVSNKIAIFAPKFIQRDMNLRDIKKGLKDL